MVYAIYQRYKDDPDGLRQIIDDVLQNIIDLELSGGREEITISLPGFAKTYTTSDAARLQDFLSVLQSAMQHIDNQTIPHRFTPRYS